MRYAQVLDMAARTAQMTALAMLCVQLKATAMRGA
jgi:hypothetical protein